MTDSQTPLVVDLDGTLIKTDLLLETATQFAVRHPLRLLPLLARPPRSRSLLKARLADACTVDAASLPYNERLVAWLREERLRGRHLVLATASHRSLAEAVQGHLGLFDEVLATEGDVNLKSHRKRDLLVGRFGEGGFDYVGNHASDLPVWRSAGRAYVVGASPRLVARARSQGGTVDALESGRRSWARSLFVALRPHQWVKNLLVLLPLFAAHTYGDLASAVHAIVAMVVFCLLASGVYVLNDLTDLGDDRYHPLKRQRPFARGDLSLWQGWLAWPALFIAAWVIAALYLPRLFMVVLGTYFVLTLAYSFRLKQLVVVDVLTLAGLYTLRVLAGAAAIAVEPSFWLLAFSVFFFLSLAFIKRYSELRAAPNSGGDQIRGRGYVRGDLEMVSVLGVAAGYISVLILALYVNDGLTSRFYRSPRLIWLACPLLLFWISRAWVVAHRGDMHGDPIVFALKDRASWVVGACLVALFALATAIG
jgi:4-hydroxybenzoate polyprenyltransferase